MVNRDVLVSALSYNKDTGEFVWIKRTSNRINIGDVAGRVSQGYVGISLNGKRYQAHRLAWLYVYGEWPDKMIDHINQNRSDNRIANLRLANKSENAKNTKLPSDNSSGRIGVSWNKNKSKWESYINVSKRRKNLGTYDDYELACFVREEAEDLCGYSPLHGKTPLIEMMDL